TYRLGRPLFPTNPSATVLCEVDLHSLYRPAIRRLRRDGHPLSDATAELFRFCSSVASQAALFCAIDFLVTSPPLPSFLTFPISAWPPLFTCPCSIRMNWEPAWRRCRKASTWAT